MRTFGTGILLLILALGWTATSHSFGFGDVFKTPKVEDLVPKVPPPPKTKELVPKIPEPPKTRDIIPQAPQPPKTDGLIPAVPQVPGVSTNLSAPKTPAQPAPPAQAPPSGGLIGLGQSLGVIDKKTSKVLQTTTQTLKAFQPIGFEEEKPSGVRWLWKCSANSAENSPARS